MDRSQQRAAGLLAHYFMTAFNAAGLDWDSDHAAEVEEIVEAFTDIVRDEIRIAMREKTDRRHAGLGLPCDVCPGKCTIDDQSGGAA